MAFYLMINDQKNMWLSYNSCHPNYWEEAMVSGKQEPLWCKAVVDSERSNQLFLYLSLSQCSQFFMKYDANPTSCLAFSKILHQIFKLQHFSPEFNLSKFWLAVLNGTTFLFCKWFNTGLVLYSELFISTFFVGFCFSIFHLLVQKNVLCPVASFFTFTFVHGTKWRS